MSKGQCEGCGIEVEIFKGKKEFETLWCDICRPLLDYHLNEITKIINVCSAGKRPTGNGLIIVSKRQVRKDEPIFHVVDFIVITSNNTSHITEARQTENEAIAAGAGKARVTCTPETGQFAA